MILSISMPKGGRFFKSRQSDDSSSTDVKTPLDLDEVLEDVAEEQEPDLRGLNTALGALVDIFPDVQPDVFREMLLSLSKESRLEVVTEHLLRNGAQYIQGRYRQKPSDDKTSQPRHREPLPKDETFRSDKYKRAVKDTLYLEFRNLSHSSIRAVLAEHNYSYTLARPTLQHLSSRSWRATISGFFTRKRPATSDPDSHPYVEWLPNSTDPLNLFPYLKRTGCTELDQELYRMYIAPVLARQNQERLDQDQALAYELNETEAEEADALFDCECCFTSYPFEYISTCDSGVGHFICFRCIKLAANEALYGQGWARNIDLTKSSLRCLAPSVPECQGCINPELIQRALCTEKDGATNWQKLQERVISENLIKSQLPLLRCLSCPYAELDEPTAMRFRDPMALTAHLVHMPMDPLKSLIALMFIFVYPLVWIVLHPLLILVAVVDKPTYTRIQASRTRTIRRRRGLKFTCQSLTCGKSSCTNCGSPWSDPHACNEASLQSLRQAIEAATTSSIKRTCPKCNLSFVKSSGCNKLVCNCGYTMCYVCRQEIGREGYGHFCQHFREAGGRCSECDRCDLYIVEDEEGTIRRAAIQAEKDWLQREGKSKDTDDKLGAVVNDVLANATGGKRCDYDAWLDFFMMVLLE
ncbi:unnamed protein product [Aureobasidium uvarum]|uniref:RING-type domain-containing protein n=1 Tax=Aureobasidium uvarum TaxID=2773716 RepID=A0A9N8KT81_9PEZI|nr:unnamed protein product [Aureobasidium uvarum]